ncbi:Cullin repeat-like-containing domain protein [Scheffersomyces coipomensis]|uniref:Cullin repeat-like-containing domain protein n=1 Tax=Scheffersomyces coipomensis TaxID=1788519 RepID=UPI00315CF911
MSFNIDIDEADVAVLNQNLNKSKDLFVSISKSLHTISTKSINASNNIKPILQDVNKLTNNKNQVDRGLSILTEVSESAKIINNYESILSQSIEHIGLKSYVDTLYKSKSLLAKLQGKFKRFRGIINNFTNTIDKADLKLQNYYQGLLNQGSDVLLSSPSKIQDIKSIMALYHKEQDSVQHISYSKIRSAIVVESLRSLKNASEPQDRPDNVPYEKGSNGIAVFVDGFISMIDNETKLSYELELPGDNLISLTEKSLDELVNNSYLILLTQFFNLKNPTKLLNNDTLLFEILEHLLRLKTSLKLIVGDLALETYEYKLNAFMIQYHVMFLEYFKLIDYKILSTNVQSEAVVVELMSRVRKISEYKTSLLALVSQCKLGDWVTKSPPFQFISVCHSSIPNITNDNSPEYLLTSLLSDMINAIIIDIEIRMSQPSNSSSASIHSKKSSSEGFSLLKYLDIIETIIGHAPSLHSALGSLGLERLEKLKKRFVKFVLEDWNTASFLLINEMNTITKSQAHNMTSNAGTSSPRSSTATSSIASTANIGKHLTSKEKDMVKDMFKHFNEAFEEALKNYEKFNITDPQLRNYLGNEIKKLVSNTYFKVYDSFINTDFAKNKTKYIKYDKVQFLKILNDRL